MLLRGENAFSGISILLLETALFGLKLDSSNEEASFLQVD